MKRGMMRAACLALCLCLLAGPAGAAGGGLWDYWQDKTGGRDPETTRQEEKQYNTAAQLTEDDIFAMNGGNAAMLYTDGYLTFLRGRYYDERILNSEDAILSLNGVAQLLGLSRGSEFYAVFTERNLDGYTIYTYQQRYGDLTLQNAVLKVIVDPQGYAAGLVSSFTPNVGFAPEDEPSITPEEAAEVVRQSFPGYTLTFYPEHTRQTSVTIDGVAVHAWAVFTDYPPEAPAPEGRRFLEHLVSYEGEYFLYMAVSSPDAMTLGDEAETALALGWFEGMTPDTYTGQVTLHDGTKRTVTVPVCRDAAGKYYLADPERHILLSDYYSFIYEHRYAPWTSDDNAGWPEHYLITYDTYIRVYDFFAGYGLPSVDGCGMPVLILTDYCDAKGVPENNAGSLGTSAGWTVFSASSANDFGESVDVIAHEFTHGITGYSATGNIYENESGALNEALSDIIGNLVEQLMGATEDEAWLMGETSGWTVRSMSFPWAYRQPVRLGGSFYQEPARTPELENDMGGVHTNSGIVAHAAWEMCAAGLDQEEAFKLWMEAISLLTPRSGFREIHQALTFAAEMRGLDVNWMGVIEMVCEQAGI